MAIKTFTTGEVLTAADTNTYLANSGLVYIKEQTMTQTTQVTSAFSSTYDNYRILVNINTHSGAAASVQAQILSGTTALNSGALYRYALQEQSYASGVVVTSNNSGANFWAVGRVAGDGASSTFAFDIFNPNKTVKTFFQSRYTDNDYSGTTGGMINNALAYDGIQIYISSAMSGTVTVFGYRKA